jgi:hypothetical protein
MTDEIKKPETPKPTTTRPAATRPADVRKERLAMALRANLRRRKEQSRQREKARDGEEG